MSPIPPHRWKLEDAKARFSEVVKRAHLDGPQEITVRGRRSVVIVDADAYDRLAQAAPHVPLVAFLESLNLDALDLGRDADPGRETDL